LIFEAFLPWENVSKRAEFFIGVCSKILERVGNTGAVSGRLSNRADFILVHKQLLTKKRRWEAT
jgi:hypothetical protein